MPSVDAVAKPDAHVVPWSYQGDSAVVASAPGHIPHALGDVDVVIPVLHGPYGEDGTLQGLLELAGVPYVGAGVLASAVSMDKEYMKLIFAARGLPVGPHVIVRERDWPAAPTPTAAPGSGGSRSSRARLAAVRQAGQGRFEPGHVQGERSRSAGRGDRAGAGVRPEGDRRGRPDRAREIEVAVLQGLDGAPPDTSLPGELRLEGSEEFYDFEAKYLSGSSGMLIPAPIPSADLQRIREMAAVAFDAVSAEGLARVDFFYLPDGQILINEINTFPGMSPTSYFQKMWEATGMAFPQVIDRLLATALARGRVCASRRAGAGERAGLGGRLCAARRQPAGGRLLPARGNLLLVAIYKGLEVGAGPELGHRGLGDLD